jgi:hypothetical protein
VPGFAAKGIFQLDGYIHNCTVARLHEIVTGFVKFKNTFSGLPSTRMNKAAPQEETFQSQRCYMDFLQKVPVTARGRYNAIFEGSRESERGGVEGLCSSDRMPCLPYVALPSPAASPTNGRRRGRRRYVCP